jgi:diadenylate cyclase
MEEEKKEIQVKLVENKKEIRKTALNEVLKMVSPGTMLRTAIEGVQKAKTGGLIVVDNEEVQHIFEGGFKINSRFTPQRIIELGKMDGAIIISKDLKKILYANVLLTPNNSIPSNETGTRHKAAERTAKQTGTIAICVSQRRDEIALFYEGLKYVIRDTNDIIRRATSILQIIEKHREIFDKNKEELDKEELKKKPRAIKALLFVQRGIMISKISEELRAYILELGTEGTIVKSRTKELLYRVEKDVEAVLKDYSKIGFSKSNKILSILSYEELLEINNIKQCLGISEDIVFSKGHRLLEKVGINDEDAGMLIKEFKTLNNILDLKKEEIQKFFSPEKSDEIFEKLGHIRE